MLGHCDACPCPDSPRIVYGTGTSPCTYLLLGAGPGKTESQVLRSYSGLAGQELDNTYLPLGGLDRETCHISNVSLCFDGTNRPVPDKRIQSCARWHLPELLSRVQPEVIVLMGGGPCRIADPLPTLDGEGQRLRLDLHRGIPQWGSILNGLWTGWIWPMFEPALGLRDTPRMEQLLTDWTNFGAWRRGEWRPLTYDSTVKLDYRLARTTSELYDYLDCPNALIEQGLDTENHGPVPFSIQISHTPGTARMMLWQDREVVKAFADWVDQHPVVDWYLHQAAHDLDWTEKMGVRLVKYHDTLQELYHLCYLPQGLKPACYRLFGETLKSWEDVVLPASRDAVCNWMRDGIELASHELVDASVTTYKRGVCAVCWHAHAKKPCGRCGCQEIPAVTGRIAMAKSESKPGAVEKILKHVLKFTESAVDADDPYDPWKALAKMQVEGLRGDVAEDWEWELVEKELGARPILGIGNCSLEEATVYGCSDASHELALAQELRRRRQDPRWRVDPSDFDLPITG